MKNKLLFVGLIASSIIVNAQQNSEKEKTIELKIIYEKGKIKLADKTKTYTKLDII